MTTTITHLEEAAATASVVHLQSGLPKEELVVRLNHAFRGGDLCNHAMAFYLEDMDKRGVHKALGYASAAQFAINHFKMGSRRAYQLIAVGKQLRRLPMLRASFEGDEITWSKVRRIASIATTETEAAWLDRCRDLRQEEVEALLASCKVGDEPPSGGSGLPTTLFRFRVLLDPLEHGTLERAHQKLMAECGHAVTEKDLLNELLSLFLSSDADGSVPGRAKIDGSLYRVAVEDVESDPAADAPVARASAPRAKSVLTDDEAVPLMTRAYERVSDDAVVTPKMRRRLLARDGHQCVFCHSKRSLMVHHVVWRCHQGPTVDTNMITVCSHCHARVHDGYLRISGSPAEGWIFRDRDGRDLAAGRLAWQDLGAWPKPHTAQTPMQVARTRNRSRSENPRSTWSVSESPGEARFRLVWPELAVPEDTLANAELRRSGSVAEKRTGPELGRATQAKSKQVDSAEPRDTVVVSREWWLENEHNFTWSKNGRHAKLRAGFLLPGESSCD